MTEQPTYETALGSSSRDTITLLGQDLARDVMGTGCRGRRDEDEGSGRRSVVAGWKG